MKKNKNLYFHFKEFKGLSDRTSTLLSSQESYHMDFKRSVEGLKPKDIVAFANSKFGGTILIGVEETENAAGIQRGRIIGCKVNDREKIKILNKAQSCIPAVEVEIIIENISCKPIFRVEISSGKDKPYCTSDGVYMVRGDGRNNPLAPSELLSIFLDGQGKKLLNKFNIDSHKIDRKIYKTKKQVERLTGVVNSLNINVKQELEDLSHNMQSWSGDINNKFDSLISFFRIMEIVYNNSNADADFYEDSVFKN